MSASPHDSEPLRHPSPRGGRTVCELATATLGEKRLHRPVDSNGNEEILISRDLGTRPFGPCPNGYDLV